MRIFELSSFEIRVKSLVDKWQKFAESYKAGGRSPDVNIFNNWLSDTFGGKGRTINPTIGPITSLQGNLINKYLARVLSYYDSNELWQSDLNTTGEPSEKPTDSFSSQSNTAAVSTPSADAKPTAGEPATPKQSAPTAGQEILLPGTQYKYKFSPSWLDSAGEPAPEAVANVLGQLSNGVNPADIDFNDLTRARRAMGLLESNRVKRKSK
jgi:hypothetical protein